MTKTLEAVKRIIPKLMTAVGTALVMTLLCVTLCRAEANVQVKTDKESYLLGEEITVTVYVNGIDVRKSGADTVEIHVPVDQKYFEFTEGSGASYALTQSGASITCGFAKNTSVFKYVLVDVANGFDLPETGMMFGFKMKAVGAYENGTKVKITPKIEVFCKGSGNNIINEVLEAEAELTNPVAEPNVKYYTVTFVTEDGETVIATRKVKEGEGTDFPATPEIEGKTFSTWIGDPSKVYTDMTVKARYKDKMYLVTFYGGNNEVYASETVRHGQAAKTPDNPQMEGYEFRGWLTDFSCVKTPLNIYPNFVKINPEPTPTETTAPTSEPTTGPTTEPTAGPTTEPTAGPTTEPTADPTAEKTPEGEQTPSPLPTKKPNVEIRETNIKKLVLICAIIVLAVASVTAIIIIIMKKKEKK